MTTRQTSFTDLPAETLSCRECDAEQDSLADAIAEGWTEILYEPDGLWFNYTARCRDCVEDERRELHERATAMALNRKEKRKAKAKRD